VTRGDFRVDGECPFARENSSPSVVRLRVLVQRPDDGVEGLGGRVRECTREGDLRPRRGDEQRHGVGEAFAQEGELADDGAGVRLTRRGKCLADALVTDLL